ncbi:MAG: SDR family oxidoreductase [Bacteroidota bacterium]|nr:SDR family oxidoreductase [Candidatus Kapabacteria bacterium]MDW8220972.1 SDR family oxidoreductase [Bacteroidota bacterium]
MNLEGKICLITGATSGIGKETARALASMGAHIILPARNLERAERVKADILQTTPRAAIEIMECELASFASITSFVQSFKARYSNLHILINNAGLIETKRKLSRDGIEMTFAVNHLAPFLLTKLLLDTIQRSTPARIINVSSEAHHSTTINFDDIEGKKHYNGWRAYAQSKLANILFTRHLAIMLQGTGISVNCLHPGVVATDLFDVIPAPFNFLIKLFMISPAKGAETTIYLASSPEVEGITGEYFDKKKIAIPSIVARDADIAARLWQLSEQYVVSLF